MDMEINSAEIKRIYRIGQILSKGYYGSAGHYGKELKIIAEAVEMRNKKTDLKND